MANRVEPVLPPALIEELQKERFVTIATVDYETGGPNVTAISWIYAKDEKKINFVVDKRSRIIQNLQENNLIAISVIANETTYSIVGEATIKVEQIENIPLKLSLVTVDVKEVRDVMFYGSKISLEPKYDKTYDPIAAAKLDGQVMNTLKNA